MMNVIQTIVKLRDYSGENRLKCSLRHWHDKGDSVDIKEGICGKSAVHEP